LNAKHHENEAYVVAQAGRKGAITVSTNMAGRGTDIILGGNPEMLARLEFREAGRLPTAEPDAFAELVKKYEASCKVEHDDVIANGGLHIVGTERHESRRIDNQLRGRAGRQGDPGSSRFYLSLEDDLMRIFGGERVKGMMERMGMPDDEPIEHPWVTRSVENAQRKVEERNFDIRKNLLEYDDVMNAQRKTVYAVRQQLLEGRYAPEEMDELGKPTGNVREIQIDPKLREAVAPLVAQLFGMFAEQPVTPRDEQGRARPPTRAELEGITTLVEIETLEREVYSLWGVRLGPDYARDKKPIELYDALEELVARGLTEQRERLLDLIDRVMSAMVEESCPRNRPPEDWDWTGIHEGFKEHIKKPLPKTVDDLGEVERLARAIFETAEQALGDKQKEVGVENLLRLFRHFYLEEIDREWVDHLTNMEHLRDGIGLRGYGQRDPKNEYKKEGYNLFLNMMANVSSNVLVKVFDIKGAQRADDIAAMEAAAEARHQQELEAAVARHPGDIDEPGDSDPLARARESAQSVPARPSPSAAPKIGRNDLCPCGSGKKFKKCHGAALEDEEDEERPTA
jgi:preprotein translocase subunit SecA